MLNLTDLIKKHLKTNFSIKQREGETPPQIDDACQLPPWVLGIGGGINQ